MSHPAQQEVPGAPQSAKRRLVSPANTSSPGFHPDYPAENHQRVTVLSAHRIEVVPHSVAELRRQQFAWNHEVRRRQREEDKRQEEETFYARAANLAQGPKRNTRRGKGRRRHQRS